MDLKRFHADCVRGDNGCIEYRTRLNIRTGRAYVQEGKRRLIAARWYWRKICGLLSAAAYVLHKCDNPACVNIDHLFLGTQADNVRDRDAKLRGRGNSARCVNGHAFDASNTRRYGPMGRYRKCRACERAGSARYRVTKQAAVDWA